MKVGDLAVASVGVILSLPGGISDEDAAGVDGKQERGGGPVAVCGTAPDLNGRRGAGDCGPGDAERGHEGIGRPEPLHYTAPTRRTRVSFKHRTWRRRLRPLGPHILSDETAVGRTMPTWSRKKRRSLSCRCPSLLSSHRRRRTLPRRPCLRTLLLSVDSRYSRGKRGTALPPAAHLGSLRSRSCGGSWKMSALGWRRTRRSPGGT